MTIRAAIIAALERDGRSIAALARASGVPRPSLSAFLAGTRTANAETLDRILAALNLRIVSAAKNPAPLAGDGAEMTEPLLW